MGYTVNNVANIIIGRNIARAATSSSTLASSTVAEPANLANGEVVVTDESGYILTYNTSGITAIPKVYIVQGQGASKPLLKSDAIFRNGVTNYKGAAYTACTEQVDYIGYNPTAAAGSIEVINSNQYEVQALLRPISFMFGDKLNVVFANYKSSSAATQSEVAKGLAKNLILNTQKYPNIPFVVERVNDASTTITNFTGIADMIYLTKGSTTVYFYVTDTTSGYVASTGSTTVGDVWNLPSTQGRTFTFTATADDHKVIIGSTVYTVADAGSAAQNATAIAAAINADTDHIAAALASSSTVTVTYNTVFSTPPVVISAWDSAPAQVAVTVASGNDTNAVKYIAAATVSAAASFELDIAWQGATGFAFGGTVGKSNAGIAGSASNWGIKLTGYPTQYTIGAKKYEKSRWATTLQTCGATTVDTAYVVANEGIGVYAQISDMEWFMQGFLGGIGLDRIQVPPVSFIANTETFGNYSVLELNFQEAVGTTILGTAPSFKQCYIAMNKLKGSTATGFIASSQANAASTSAVAPVLDAWLNGLFAAQVSNI